MAAAPHIVSFWRDKERQHFLCSGLLLDGRHVLTVAHAFKELPPGGAAYVFLISGRDAASRVSLLQRHQTFDAALFELDEEVAGLVSPTFPERHQDLARRAVCLHVIDPDTRNYANPANYAISNYDAEHREYVIAPDSAMGYSGGVVECDGRIVGLLNRRVQGDPLARAISMAALRQWIAWVVGATPDQRDGGQAEFDALRDLVGDEILRRLTHPGTSLLRERGGFPGDATALAGLAAAERFQRMVVVLHNATVDCIDTWKANEVPRSRRDAVKEDCFVILGELIKLAVDKQSPLGDRVRISAVSPDRIFVPCHKVGTAAAVYCALREVPLLLDEDVGGRDLAGPSVVDLDNWTGGVGLDAERDAYRAMWWSVKGTPVPPEPDSSDNLDLLCDAIDMERNKFGNSVPVVVAKAPPEWLENGGLATAVGRMNVGLALRQPEDCPVLIVKEVRLINLICKYLALWKDL